MTEKLKVYEAINNVQAALAKDGISKDRKNLQQNYSFRGIDDIYGALAPHLAKYKLCIMPRVLSRSCEERTTKTGGVLFYVIVDVEYDFICTEDGSKHVAKTFGEAMDSADKATNKAMSAAYKYVCLQAFCIPTEGDNDADNNTPDPAPKKQPPAVKKQPEATRPPTRQPERQSPPPAAKTELSLSRDVINAMDCCQKEDELVSYCSNLKKELGTDYDKYKKSVLLNYARRSKEIAEGK